MTLELFAQLLVNGLAMGMIYVLIVLGLDVIIRTTSILNFAHGQFYTIGAFTFWFTYWMLHLNIVVALVLTVLALVLLGGISYLSIFNLVRRRFTPATPLSSRLLMSAVSSVGLMMILSQGKLLSFGTAARGIPSIFPQMVTIANITLPLERLVILLVSLSIAAGLYFLFFKTRLGKSMRAVSLDAEASSLQGINTTRVYLVGFTLGCALAGMAGALIAPVFAVTTEMGTAIIFTAFIVMLVGGIGSYKGAVLGGLLVGMILSFGFQFIGGLSQMLLFIAVIVILIFKPGGLVGEVHD